MFEVPRLRAAFITEDFSFQLVPLCTHNHLQRVDISGFLGLKGQVELVWYILDNAVALKLLSIDTSWRDGCHAVSDKQMSFGHGRASKFLLWSRLKVSCSREAKLPCCSNCYHLKASARLAFVGACGVTGRGVGVSCCIND